MPKNGTKQVEKKKLVCPSKNNIILDKYKLKKKPANFDTREFLLNSD